MEDVLLIECAQIEAQKIEQCLKEEDIPCRVEEPLNVIPTTSDITPTYKIFVAQNDFDDAKKVLEQINICNSVAYSWCPECGGEYIEKIIVHKKPKRLVFILLVVLALPLFFFPISPVFPIIGLIMGGVYYLMPRTETIFHCKECGHKFTHY